MQRAVTRHSLPRRGRREVHEQLRAGGDNRLGIAVHWAVLEPRERLTAPVAVTDRGHGHGMRDASPLCLLTSVLNCSAALHNVPAKLGPLRRGVICAPPRCRRRPFIYLMGIPLPARGRRRPRCAKNWDRCACSWSRGPLLCGRLRAHPFAQVTESGVDGRAASAMISVGAVLRRGRPRHVRGSMRCQRGSCTPRLMPRRRGCRRPRLHSKGGFWQRHAEIPVCSCGMQPTAEPSQVLLSSRASGSAWALFGEADGKRIRVGAAAVAPDSFIGDEPPVSRAVGASEARAQLCCRNRPCTSCPLRRRWS